MNKVALTFFFLLGISGPHGWSTNESLYVPSNNPSHPQTDVPVPQRPASTFLNQPDNENQRLKEENRRLLKEIAECCQKNPGNMKYANNRLMDILAHFSKEDAPTPTDQPADQDEEKYNLAGYKDSNNPTYQQWLDLMNNKAYRSRTFWDESMLDIVRFGNQKLWSNEEISYTIFKNKGKFVSESAIAWQKRGIYN